MTSKAPFRYSLPLVVSASLICLTGSACAKIIFKADFETGDLSQWSTTGTRGQNATTRNVQVVTGIVQQGKYAGKFTIHEDDVFNAQQLRVQVGGPKVTVEEGSDTYMSFYMYMAEPPKDRDNFFYWEGTPPPKYDNVMTWWVQPKVAVTCPNTRICDTENIRVSPDSGAPIPFVLISCRNPRPILWEIRALQKILFVTVILAISSAAVAADFAPALQWVKTTGGS